MQEIKDFLWNNFVLIWAVLGSLGNVYQWLVNRRDQDLEVMSEFETNSKSHSENGRKLRLINNSGNPIKVLKIKTKKGRIANTTPLDMNLANNNNQFFIEMIGRTGEVEIDLIFEGKLRRKYIQTITYKDGTRPTENDEYVISRAKRYKKFGIFPQ